MAVERGFPGLLVVAAVPPTLLILTDHAALGAAMLVVALFAWVAHATMEARTERARAASTARAATHLTGSVTVLHELRQRVSPDDEDELFDPADDVDRPWVRLYPSDW